jgi:hypothetical protein
MVVFAGCDAGPPAAGDSIAGVLCVGLRGAVDTGAVVDEPRVDLGEAEASIVDAGADPAAAAVRVGGASTDPAHREGREACIVGDHVLHP